MSQRRDLPYLIHILEGIERIEEYVAGLSEAQFAANHLVQDGVIRQLTIIGEATKLLSDGLRMKYTGVPWRQIARMRDNLVHRYFGVDVDAVWLTAKQDVPALRTALTTIIHEVEISEAENDRTD